MSVPEIAKADIVLDIFGYIIGIIAEYFPYIYLPSTPPILLKSHAF